MDKLTVPQDKPKAQSQQPPDTSQNQENQINKAIKNIVIVDQNQGEVRTIQKAIDTAEEGSIIKIVPGLYQENLVVTKAGLKFEPKDKIGDVIILVQKQPAFLIDIQQNQKCYIVGLKLAQCGNNEYEKAKGDNQEKQGIKTNIMYYDNKPNNVLSKITPETELSQLFKTDKSIDTIVYLKSGRLFLEDCLMSMNFVMSSYKSILPGVIVEEDGEIIMNRCEIKGHKTHETIGILMRKCSGIIKDCKIHNHQLGGIHIWSTEKSKIKILNTKIINNVRSGIVAAGIDGEVFIESNKIENNYGVGLKIGIGNKSQVNKNEFRQNICAIEVVSAEPLIINNIIEKNSSFGILTRVYGDMRCDAKIVNNPLIASNKEYGIVCQGQFNYTRIEQNQFIGYNKKAGIKAEDYATISITKNNIQKNIGQGILLVETSDAVIERNKISDNLKANIALGGVNSVNTFIVENEIFGGRCEGIFLIDSQQCWINRNRIYENNDGIIAVTSIPRLEKNQIYRNKGNGIMLIKDSRPYMRDNQITNNYLVGLFIRDKSQGDIKKNVIKKNVKVNLLVEQKIQSLAHIAQENEVDGEIRIPQNYDCKIF